MISPTVTAELARLHQAELRATAGRLSLSRLFRRSPEVEARPAPTYGGITAVPALPLQHRAADEPVHHHAA